MASCNDIARRRGVSRSTVERRCEDQTLPAVRNERGEWEIDADYADAVPLLHRQTAVSPRASLLAASDASRRAHRAIEVADDSIQTACAALVRGDDEAARLAVHVAVERSVVARQEALRALREVEHAAGVSGRSPRREGP